MRNRWLLPSKALLFVSLLFILTVLVACGASAPEAPAQEPAAEPQASQQTAPEPAQQPAAAQEPAPTAEPAPAVEAEMAEPTVVRYVESQGEIQVETNQHCGGNRPIISQFLPYVEFLVEADPVTAEFNPWLAESWETTPDAKVWTFKLREDVQFHHGYGEFTARDIANMAVAKGDESCASSTTSFWKEMAQAEVVDDYTIKFHMNNPSLPMPSVVSNLPTGLELISFSKDQLDEVGYENFDDIKPASTSYYQFLERKLGEGVVYERTPYEHWRYQSPFEEMEIRWIGEETTRLAGLLAGEIHAIALSRDLQGSAIDGGMKVIPAQQAFSQLSLFFGGMYFMPGDPDFDPTTPWADLRVRKAMNKAINRDELNEHVLKGQGSLMLLTQFHPVLGVWNEDWENDWEELYGFDTEAARELMAQAGYTPDNPMPFTSYNYFSSDEPETAVMLEALINYWQPIGIDVTLLDSEWGTVRSNYRERTDFIKKGGWGNVITMRSLTNRLRSWSSAQGVGGSGYYSDVIEQNYAEFQAMATVDNDRIHELLLEMGNDKYYNFADIPFFWFTLQVTFNPDVVESWTFPGTAGSKTSHWDLLKAAQ